MRWSVDATTAYTPGVGEGTSALLNGLNEAQRRAVDHEGRPMVVLAGPGTGKTRVIIARIARLIERGSDPRSILCLTFTIKAAEEMAARLADAVGPEIAQEVTLGTFHSFGARILRRFHGLIGLPERPHLLDSAQAARLLRGIIARDDLFDHLAAHGRESVIPEARRFIGACRNAGLGPAAVMSWCRARLNETEVLAEEGESYVARHREHLARAYRAFDQASLREGTVTFDDLLARPLRLFEEKPFTAALVRAEYRHILVDEFQDENAAQIALLRCLAPPGSGPRPDLFVVGDDDQAIYAFRGADPRAFELFASIWPDHSQETLSVNYRSTPAILRVGNTIIGRAKKRFNAKKQLKGFAAEADGPPVEGVTLANDNQAGPVIAAMIEADRRSNPQRRYSDFAVICRSNSFRDQVAEELRVVGLPVDLRLPATPMDDPAVQDLLAWARVLSEPQSSHDARRLLLRPPASLEPDRVRRWELAHTRAAAEGDERPLLRYIAETEGDESVVRLWDRAHRYAEAAAHEPASGVIEMLIHDLGLAHVGLPAGRARAQRIRHLVHMIRYARSKQSVLEPPGDLAAFLRYLADLDKAEQSLATADLERLDIEEEDGLSPEGVDAVRVLTAHKAKGLEFDTVFVARVRPGHGFPQSDRNDDDDAALPSELTGREPSIHEDEERRLFYVACTRARRRLVLVAKHKHKPGKATDYFTELESDSSGVAMKRSTASDWLGENDAPEVDGLEAAGTTGDVRAGSSAIDRALRRARNEAFAALHDAGEKGGSSEALLDAASRLAETARRIAALAHVTRSGEAPAWLQPDSALGRMIAALRKANHEDAEPGGLVRPLSGPLELSYSKLERYEQCPACFYAQHVIGLDEPAAPELLLGSVTHAALQRFYLQRAAAEGEGVPPESLPALPQLLALAEEAWREQSPRDRPLDRRLLDQLRAQLAQFMTTLHDEALILHLERAFSLPFRHGGLTHKIRGKIDRVDQLADGRFRIIDYKTGRATKGKLEPKKDDLQLCIYAMALPHVLDPSSADTDSGEPLPPPPGLAEYWMLSVGERGSIDLAALDLAQTRADIARAIDGMHAGRFERAPKTCRGLCWILDESQR